MFSSENNTWETPQWLFEILNEEFKFTLDVCADINTNKCEKFFDVKKNGLVQDWSKDICWMNPPYNQSKLWIKKAYEEAQKGAVVVALLPARTDTIAFHEYIYGQQEIRFIKGRLKFGKSKNSAPFPSMLVIFRQNEG